MKKPFPCTASDFNDVVSRLYDDMTLELEKIVSVYRKRHQELLGQYRQFRRSCHHPDREILRSVDIWVDAVLQQLFLHENRMCKFCGEEQNSRKHLRLPLPAGCIIPPCPGEFGALLHFKESQLWLESYRARLLKSKEYHSWQKGTFKVLKITDPAYSWDKGLVDHFNFPRFPELESEFESPLDNSSQD